MAAAVAVAAAEDVNVEMELIMMEMVKLTSKVDLMVNLLIHLVQVFTHLVKASH